MESSVDIDSAVRCKSSQLYREFKPKEYIDLLFAHDAYKMLHEENLQLPDIRAQAAAKALSPVAANALSPAAVKALSPAASNALSPAAAYNENGISSQIPTVNMDQLFPPQVPMLAPPPDQPLQSRRRRTAAQIAATQPDIGAGVVSNRRTSERIAAAAADESESKPRRLDGGNKTRKMFIHKNKIQSMLRKHQTTNRFRLHRRNKHSQRRNK